MTAIIHRFRYPWGARHREIADPMECAASDALEALASAMDTARGRAAYIDTLVQQDDGVTWLAEDWTPRVDRLERDRREDERAAVREVNLHHRSLV